MRIGEALSPVVDLVFPPRCPLCGAAIGVSSGLCAACWQELAIPGEPSCARCQRPFTGTAAEPGAICLPCLADPPLHDGIAAGTLYGDASRKLILSFKHGRRIALAPMLARLIAARLPPLEGEWKVVPAPLHRWRLWSRGYNQAALLAREVARLTDQTLLVDALVRTKRTPMLGGMGRRARAKAVAGALNVASTQVNSIRGSQVILIDDVLTSGATSTACVRALKKAGARKVIVGCFARVMDEGKGARPSPQTETPGA